MSANIKVFKHPTTGNIKGVNLGFSVIAFLFPLLWLLFNGIWGLFFMLFIFAQIINVLFSVAGNANDEVFIIMIFMIFTVFQLSMRIYLGKNAGKLKEEKLLAKGFIEIDKDTLNYK